MFYQSYSLPINVDGLFTELFSHECSGKYRSVCVIALLKSPTIMGMISGVESEYNDDLSYDWERQEIILVCTSPCSHLEC